MSGYHLFMMVFPKKKERSNNFFEVVQSTVILGKFLSFSMVT
jgi:hypothetical protein